MRTPAACLGPPPSVVTLTCLKCGSTERPWHRVTWFSLGDGDGLELHPVVDPVGICAACRAPFDGPRIHIDVESRMAASRVTAAKQASSELRFSGKGAKSCQPI